MKTENSLFGFISMFIVTILIAIFGVTKLSAPLIAIAIGIFGISTFAVARREKAVIDIDLGAFTGSVAFAIGEVIYYLFFFR